MDTIYTVKENPVFIFNKNKIGTWHKQYNTIH